MTKATTDAVTDNQTEATATKNPNQDIIELDTPIQRGKETITSVTIRKPNSGELRGVALQELAQLDVTSLITVLPRITIPTLVRHEVEQMEPADLTKAGLVVAGFLLPKKTRDEISPTA